jgi:radical SAM protein with 4Fe4S-binding SPASM domain
MGCMAVVDRIYMDVSGNLHPCGITDNEFYTRDLIDNKLLIPQNINILRVNSLKEIIRSSYFLSFLKLRANKKIYTNKIPCNTCDYFHICIPCPIINYNKKIIEECYETFRREKEFENSVLNSFVILHKNKIKLDGKSILVYDKFRQVYKSTNSTAREIILLVLDKKLKVKDIVNELKSKYSKVSQRQLERDIIDFIWYLKILDVVDLIQ